LNVLASQASKKLSELQPQHLSNMAWAFAKIQYMEANFFAGICKQSLKQIDQFGAQNLGNLA